MSRSAALGALAAALFGCGSCGGASGGPPKVFDPPPPVDATVDLTPRPEVAVSVNGSTAVELGVGWPWVIAASIHHPAAFGAAPSAPIEVPGDSALTLTLTDAQGRSVPLALDRPNGAMPGIALDANNAASMRWRLPATEAARLAAGNYTLVLSLDLPSAKAKSPPARVTISASPDAGPFAERLARADDAIARGDMPAAEAEADAILQLDPTQVRALMRRGIAREARGDLPGAYAAFNDAVAQSVRRNPKQPEGGPRHLQQRLSSLAGRVDGGAY